MFHNAKWWFGLLPGVLLLLGTIVFLLLVHADALSMGAALYLFFILGGALVLMSLLVIVLVLLKQTRVIGYGMAGPVLISHAGWLVQDLITTRGESYITPSTLVIGGATLCVVAIIALTSRRRAGGPTSSMG